MHDILLFLSGLLSFWLLERPHLQPLPTTLTASCRDVHEPSATEPQAPASHIGIIGLGCQTIRSEMPFRRARWNVAQFGQDVLLFLELAKLKIC